MRKPPILSQEAHAKLTLLTLELMQITNADRCKKVDAAESSVTNARAGLWCNDSSSSTLANDCPLAAFVVAGVSLCLK
jgi:hypothetical protein